MQELTDVRYEEQDGLAWITIDRPERLNAFTAHTVDELIDCFKHAWAAPEIGVIALTGAGERAFCVGGDQKQRESSGDYGPSRSGLFEIETLHRLMREVPKPVIAAVNGLAIGGGHVLHVICDLSVAAEHARFGQAGPRVGSFDAGFGTAYLARVVGEKRAREIWFLCRQYDAHEAERWGLVNSVVADRRAARGGAPLRRPDPRPLPHRASLPQAVLQRRLRAHRRAGRARLQRAARVRRLRGGTRGRARVQRQAAARFRALPRARLKAAVAAAYASAMPTHFRSGVSEGQPRRPIPPR